MLKQLCNRMSRSCKLTLLQRIYSNGKRRPVLSYIMLSHLIKGACTYNRNLIYFLWVTKWQSDIFLLGDSKIKTCTHHTNKTSDVEPDIIPDNIRVTDSGYNRVMWHVFTWAAYIIIELIGQIIVHTTHVITARPLLLTRVIVNTSVNMYLKTFNNNLHTIFHLVWCQCNYSGTLKCDHLDNLTTLAKRPLFSRPVLV